MRGGVVKIRMKSNDFHVEERIGTRMAGGNGYSLRMCMSVVSVRPGGEFSIP